jgi:hypothetical protein
VQKKSFYEKNLFHKKNIKICRKLFKAKSIRRNVCGILGKRKSMKA